MKTLNADVAPQEHLDSPQWWVVCLCAAWCTTCGEYRGTFDGIASQWPGLRFEWVDIEDESALIGDLDIETFPTLLIGEGNRSRFMGPLLPQSGILNRLIDSLVESDTQSPTSSVSQADHLLEDIRKSRS